MNPDTLREFPPFEDDDGVNVTNLREHCRKHADAWEADIEARDNAWALRTALIGDLVRLSKRLEAVERVRDGAASVPPEEFEERPEYWWQKVVGDLTAALAAGEGKT